MPASILLKTKIDIGILWSTLLVSSVFGNETEGYWARKQTYRASHQNEAVISVHLQQLQLQTCGFAQDLVPLNLTFSVKTKSETRTSNMHMNARRWSQQSLLARKKNIVDSTSETGKIHSEMLHGSRGAAMTRFTCSPHGSRGGSVLESK